MLAMSPSEDVSAGDDVVDSNREPPWLFPRNRKLRHLQGISVRNLSITPPGRPRGKTIDDEDIYNTLHTPAKILAMSETRSMPHSRSYTDLKLSPSKAPIELTDSDHGRQKASEGRRTRRSTLPWSGGNQEARQVKLMDVIRGRMVNTWFSIHCKGIESPVYVSDVMEKTTNPSYPFFDLEICGPHVSRQETMTFKLWAKTVDMCEYILLVELRLDLRSLQYVGKTMENFHQPFPPNSILFHFVDGVYTNFIDLPPVQATPGKSSRGSPCMSNIQLTSSYDALMRLANLDDCIQDALATREKLESQISAILHKNKGDFDTANENSQAREKLLLAKRAAVSGRKELRGSIRRREELLLSIKTRRGAMEIGRESQEKVCSHLTEAQLTLASRAKLLEKNTEEAKGQTRRICEALLVVYPIEPIPEAPLGFTIAGLALPNSSFEDIDRESVAAALGCTAHLVYLLSFYLSVPLPYPVKPFLSHSMIQDPVSFSLAQRAFPLYPVNVQYRFEYGVFLLNKDIEFLMNRRGLRAPDIRQTLPNLKYLLYVLTAGTSELPARKVGGIRGLVGRLSPSQSRRASPESITSSESVNPRKLSVWLPKMNGHVHADKDPRHLSSVDPLLTSPAGSSATASAQVGRA